MWHMASVKYANIIFLILTLVALNYVWVWSVIYTTFFLRQTAYTKEFALFRNWEKSKIKIETSDDLNSIKVYLIHLTFWRKLCRTCLLSEHNIYIYTVCFILIGNFTVISRVFELSLNSIFLIIRNLFLLFLCDFIRLAIIISWLQ